MYIKKTSINSHDGILLHAFRAYVERVWLLTYTHTIIGSIYTFSVVFFVNKIAYILKVRSGYSVVFFLFTLWFAIHSPTTVTRNSPCTHPFVMERVRFLLRFADLTAIIITVVLFDSIPLRYCHLAFLSGFFFFFYADTFNRVPESGVGKTGEKKRYRTVVNPRHVSQIK